VPDETEGTPFSEDCIVSGAASLAGLDVQRSVSIIITDRKALEAGGLVKKGPDYSRIRQLLNDGATVAGAEFGPVEYILRRKR
jgi:hypothetical protein